MQRFLSGQFLAALITLLWAAEATASSFAPLVVSGRVAVNEPHSCDGGTWNDLTVNTTVSWTDCHQFKRHMDASGAAITANAFDANARRPLSVTVEIEAWCIYGKSASGDATVRSRVRTQTNADGFFKVQLPGARCGDPYGVATGLAVRTSMALEYQLTDATGFTGNLRAVWERTAGETVYHSILPPSPTLYIDSGNEMVIPRFILAQDQLAFPPPSSYSLGTQTFFDGASPSYYDYLRGALGTWQTVIELHRKLRAALAADGHDALYQRMFVAAPACTTCYSLTFTTTDGGRGGAGGFGIYRPDPAAGYLTYSGLVSVGLPAHEFGHSMHGAIATNSFGSYDDSMHATYDPSGAIQTPRQPYVEGSTPQQQEMLFALMEGFGDAMGSWYLNRCAAADRVWGDPDPSWNMWNPANFASCDATNGACPYRAFRFQMLKRGIAEGSTTWDDRLTLLEELARDAASAGATMVVSNSEFKYRNFFCDLLDDNPDVSFATGQVAKVTYVQDFIWHAAERLDGRNPRFALRTFASDPPAEGVRLSIGQLLTAMDGFVTGLHAPVSTFPDPLWVAGSITDGANATYNAVRMSVAGAFSPQTLGQYIVGLGYVSRADMNGILGANRMEELP